MRPVRHLPAALFCCLAGLSPGLAAAQDVVLPDFTPAGMGDFEAADQLTDLARLALEDRGVSVLTGEELIDQVGDAADACADEVSCPVSLWNRIGPGAAVVGRVALERGLLHITVKLYENRGSRATKSWDERVPPSGAGELMLAIADELAPDLGAPPAVSRPITGIVEEVYAPIGEGRTEEEPLDEPDEAARAPDRASDITIAELKLPAGTVARYEASGMHADEWLEEKRVRVPAVFLELHAGALFGDLDRRFDTRIGLYDELGDAFSARDGYSYHTFLNGQGFTGGVALGYQVAWWVDVSVLGGVQVGNKELTTGWETWEANGNPDGSDELLDSDEVVYDPVTAVMGMLEPRVRLFPLPTGPIKPYGLVGFNVRFYDKYDVPDQDFVDYPEPTGGVAIGPTLGGGIAFDAPKGAIGFVEVPWTYVVAPAGATVEDSGGLSSTPTQFTGVGQYLVFKAGLGIHFR